MEGLRDFSKSQKRNATIIRRKRWSILRQIASRTMMNRMLRQILVVSARIQDLVLPALNRIIDIL